MNFDFSPLSQPVTPEDIKVYRATLQKKGALPKAIKIVLIVFSVIFVLFSIIPLVIASIIEGKFAVQAMFPLVFVIFFVFIVGLIYGSYKYDERRLTRIYKFTQANGLAMLTAVLDPAYAGLIFSQGYGRVINSAIVTKDGWEIGNYNYTTGSGKSRTTHHWSYMRAKLVRKLPHMVLDAKSNNMFKSGITNLPASFSAKQQMRLEGDFNDHFVVYAPNDYEVDALYVFTPDVMATLIDYGKEYDIEVIDDNLIFYSQKPIALDKQADLQKAFEIIHKISSEIIHQGDYYADHRVGDRAMDVIAPSGRRLKSGINIVGITISTAIVLYWIWIFVSSWL